MSYPASTVVSLEEKIAQRKSAHISRDVSRIRSALERAVLNPRRIQIVELIISETYGWNEPIAWICAGKVADRIGYKGAESNVSKDIRFLVKRNIIIRDGKQAWVNAAVEKWAVKFQRTWR